MVSEIFKQKELAYHYLYSLPVSGEFLLSADSLCKLFGPRLALTECRSRSGSKPFNTLMWFLKEVNFEKKVSRLQKILKNYSACKELCTQCANSAKYGIYGR